MSIPSSAPAPTPAAVMTTPTPTTTSKTLEELLDALSNELWQMIFDFTFAVTPSTINVTPIYKPPSLLQVSHHTRAQFAEQYYSLCTFRFGASASNIGQLGYSVNRCIRWLSKLDNEHVALLQAQGVRVGNMYKPMSVVMEIGEPGEDAEGRRDAGLERFITDVVRSHKIRLRDGVVRVDIFRGARQEESGDII